MKLIAVLADKLLNWFAPPITDVLAFNTLSTAEADREAWEKFELTFNACRDCFPEGWEDLIHDPVCVEDDDTPDPAPRPASASSRGGAEPAGTGPLSPVPAGAPPLHPAVIISRTFREVGVAVPAAAAEIVAIELTHFYDLTPREIRRER
jgi:hypothetical protein